MRVSITRPTVVSAVRGRVYRKDIHGYYYWGNPMVVDQVRFDRSLHHAPSDGPFYNCSEPRPSRMGSANGRRRPSYWKT
jgi:hypothetical protein